MTYLYVLATYGIFSAISGLYLKKLFKSRYVGDRLLYEFLSIVRGLLLCIGAIIIAYVAGAATSFRSMTIIIMLIPAIIGFIAGTYHIVEGMKFITQAAIIGMLVEPKDMAEIIHSSNPEDIE